MRNGYYWRDAATMLSSMKDGTVNVTITSPPYGAMKDYGSKKQIGFGQSQIAGSLHDCIAESRRKERDASVVIEAKMSKQICNALLEIAQCSIEVY